MVFPLYDDNTDRTTTPLVNYAIIALNIFVFVVLQKLGSDTGFTYSFSTVPAEILQGTRYHHSGPCTRISGDRSTNTHSRSWCRLRVQFT